MLPPVLRIALLHLAPVVGEIESNQDLLMSATRIGAAAGADWVVSGELVRTGYRFDEKIGVDWIRPQPDSWLQEYAGLTARLGVAAFVHTPDLDVASGDLYSSLFAFDRQGREVGRHRKISVIPGSEEWTTPGADAAVVTVDAVRVGMLVCADAHPVGPARRIAEQGADLIVSAAAWHPGAWGPSGEWEQRSGETGLPVVVCNRTGSEPSATFEAAESVVAHEGRRVLTFTAPGSVVFVIEIGRIGGQTSVREVDRLEM